MEVTRLFDLLPHGDKYFPREDAICGKENGVWVHYSTKDYINKVNYISYGLMQLGVKKGDRIASISNNRPEWNFLDMAILQLGAIHVSIYPTISENEYKYILHHADIKMIFVSGWELLRKIENVIAETPELQEKVYTFRNLRGFRHLNEVIELGIANPCPQYLENIKAEITPDDVVTIIYTSGTTGNPKGVMLTHRNILNNVKAIAPIIPTTPHNKALSYLPLCHAYERMLVYSWQYTGVSLYYAENVARIVDNMCEIKPNIFTSVPRLLEKIYEKILSTGRKQTGIKKKIFFWANDIAEQYSFKTTSLYRKRLRLARKLVLKKWKDALGGNLQVIVSGGAAMQDKINKIFWAMDIPVLEGYGLSETSPVIAVSSFFKQGAKFGTVGQPLPGIEVKISEDNEILTRGACVMKGYYKDEEQTKEVIDKDNWFHTGDMGTIEDEGQVRITGRKKEMFKTAMGKYVVPTIIEAKFCEESLIDNIIVLGENKKFAAALIVPNFMDLRSWCNNKGIQYTTNEEMIQHPDVKDKFKRTVDHFNKSFGEAEQVKRYILLDSEWSIQTGELTPTLKLKRNFINNKYKDKIDRLFS